MDGFSSLFASQATRDALKGGDYGALLRLARQARGLTQAQAAQLAGYSAATISRFETGARRLADIETLRRLAVALNITPELFGLAAGLVSAAAASRASAACRTRQAFSAILADTYVLASELALKANEDGMAWVAADRALPAARDSGDPAAIAAASRAVAMAMRRQGHYDGATSILTSTAQTLGAGHGNPPARVLAAYGSLLCTAAYACAQNGHKSQASDLISEARAADRMGNARAGRSVFSAANVEVYQISIHTVLGDSAGALTHARAVDQHALPTPERRARFCIDTARAWQQHGRPDQAYQALLIAERQSPEEIQRPSVKALITTMIHAPGRQPSGLHQLAQRAGSLT